MTGDHNKIKVERGLPAKDDVLDLLNEAYDEWGDIDLFTWWYDEYPNYDPEEHVFYIEIDGDLAAYRRTYYKELIDAEGNRIPVFVLGDTAVGVEYRGQGLYSALHSATVEYCRQVGARLTMTYNRTDNVTFKANRNRGWEYQKLPLQLRILNPSAVIEQYAGSVIHGSKWIEPLLKIGGHRIRIATNNSKLNLATLTNDTVGEKRIPRRTLTIQLSDRAVAQVIEVISSGNSRKIATRTGRLLASGDIRFIGKIGSHTDNFNENRNIINNTEITRTETLTPSELDAIMAVYQQTTSTSRFSFRRTRTDVRHLLKFPDSNIFLARQNGTLTGFAVTGPRQNGDIVELKVLELRSQEDYTRDYLLKTIEEFSSKQGHDLITIFSRADLGAHWASIDRQVLMWNPITDEDIPFHTNQPIDVSLYDIA